METRTAQRNAGKSLALMRRLITPSLSDKATPATHASGYGGSLFTLPDRRRAPATAPLSRRVFSRSVGLSGKRTSGEMRPSGAPTITNTLVVRQPPPPSSKIPSVFSGCWGGGAVGEGGLPHSEKAPASDPGDPGEPCSWSLRSKDHTRDEENSLDQHHTPAVALASVPSMSLH